MRTKFVRTLAFRIILIYLVAFALSAGAIVAFTYWSTAKALNAQTDRKVADEITSLTELYNQLGIAGLNDAIMDKYPFGPQGQLYYLADEQMQRVAGNLASWPALSELGGGIVEFDYEPRPRGRRSANSGVGLSNSIMSPVKASCIVQEGGSWDSQAVLNSWSPGTSTSATRRKSSSPPAFHGACCSRYF
jgi:hypothetical protein